MTAKLDGTNGLLQQYDFQAPTTGFSYTFAVGTNVLVMQPAGTLASGTITMPASPADGMTISFSSTQAITALTVAGNTGQSITGQPTSMAAGGAATFIYRLSNTTWYTQVNTAGLQGATNANALNAFVSPGTWTKPATVKSIKVTVVGGGGSVSGFSPGVGNGQGVTGGGGGGGTSIKYYPAPSLPGPQPYTVGGAGGTSSFGAAPVGAISATGGTAGVFNPNQVSFNTISSPGSAGGAGSGGTMNFNGGGGGASLITPNSAPTSTKLAITGQGGSSSFGGGGAGFNWNSTPSDAYGGTAGNNYGGGAGGGFRISNPGSPLSGASGASGVVIVEEFY